GQDATGARDRLVRRNRLCGYGRGGISSPGDSWQSPEGVNRDSYTDGLASPLHQHHIPPTAIQLSGPLAGSDDAKSGSLVALDAGGVFGKNARLKSPDAVLFRFENQSRHERVADAAPTCTFGDVNADFRHTGIHAPARNRAQRRPS